MKNKGFTLIELLGVMIILSILVLLVLPGLINVINSSNDKKDDLTVSLIKNAAELFIEDNSSNYILKEGNIYCIPLSTLISNNYLKGDIIYNGENINNIKSVKAYYTDKINYDIVDSASCTDVIG